MNRFFLVFAGLSVVGAVLQGCAPLAPGYSSASGDAAKAVSPTGFNTPDTDPPPAGALTPITAELIQAERAARPKTLSPQLLALVGEPDPYRLGPGDVVGIQVYDHPEIAFSGSPSVGGGDGASVTPAPGFLVSSAGMLTFPYAGSIRAAGMTLPELETTLVQRLSRVYKDPQLSVRIAAFRSKRIYMDGELGVRGVQVISDIPMTLPEALSRAGGVAATGDRSMIMITRNGVTTAVDMVAMIEAGLDPSRIILKNGDMVNVRSREERKVTVLGEVNQQTTVMMRNGRLSLNDALGEVGGVNLGAANPRQIFVIRNEPSGGQSIFHLDARTPTALAMADGFALRPKDIVYVDPVPLVRWNRVVTLILPSTSYISTVRDLRNTD